jgi:diacylglycerol kinase family enzyme
MRIILVANPRSGRGDGHSVTERVCSALAAAGHECEVRWTDTTINGRQIARETAGGADLLVVLGGDGSLFEVVNGIMDTTHRSRLAQIPVGTGNSFIKDLGIHGVQDGLAAILGGKLRTVDLGRFTSSSATYYFINLMGAGFVARVARLAGRCWPSSPKIFKGTHVHSPLVESFKCRTLTARFDTLEPVSPDGEQTGDTPLSAEVMPRALELYTL